MATLYFPAQRWECILFSLSAKVCCCSLCARHIACVSKAHWNIYKIHRTLHLVPMCCFILSWTENVVYRRVKEENKYMDLVEGITQPPKGDTKYEELQAPSGVLPKDGRGNEIRFGTSKQYMTSYWLRHSVATVKIYYLFIKIDFRKLSNSYHTPIAFIYKCAYI